MPSDEIKRRSAATQQYWLGFWQKAKQNEDRMGRIERFQQESRRVRNQYRGKMNKRHSPGKRLDLEHVV
jgi:hypothetical protein